MTRELPLAHPETWTEAILGNLLLWTFVVVWLIGSWLLQGCSVNNPQWSSLPDPLGMEYHETTANKTLRLHNEALVAQYWKERGIDPDAQ
jgi:hypothetical protein